METVTCTRREVPCTMTVGACVTSYRSAQANAARMKMWTNKGELSPTLGACLDCRDGKRMAREC